MQINYLKVAIPLNTQFHHQQIPAITVRTSVCIHTTDKEGQIIDRRIIQTLYFKKSIFQ